ncbi:hypothetical protein ES288_D04G139400v1 [Gossypium darwinii]|uniref:Uncharacterized protein n=1 Tax=Gossypium darwinii TaxID=34276 RepID=A0A5D2CW71_GOSDA|nr:hypothetical protein ES288_D04G139400v1 [Gossypium darwinii]
MTWVGSNYGGMAVDGDERYDLEGNHSSPLHQPSTAIVSYSKISYLDYINHLFSILMLIFSKSTSNTINLQKHFKVSTHITPSSTASTVNFLICDSLSSLFLFS